MALVALFDTMFELKTFEQQEFELEGLTFKTYPTDTVIRPI
ncbi:hypothetical protein [Paenibacillus sp. FSL L8-0644]